MGATHQYDGTVSGRPGRLPAQVYPTLFLFYHGEKWAELEIRSTDPVVSVVRIPLSGLAENP